MYMYMKPWEQGQKQSSNPRGIELSFANVTAQSFCQLRLKKLWKAISAKQKQTATVCYNLTQVIRNSIELVG